MIGLDNLTGPRPALIAEDVERLIRALRWRDERWAAGDPVPMHALERAFGVTRRTLYRYAGARVEWVELDGHRIPFLCRPGKRPVVLDARSQRRVGS